MTETVPVFQCEDCRRFIISEQTAVFLPLDSTAWREFREASCPQGKCGRNDCQSASAENCRREELRRRRRRDFRSKKICNPRQARTDYSPRHYTPPYPPDDDREVMGPDATSTYAESAGAQLPTPGPIPNPVIAPGCSVETSLTVSNDQLKSRGAFSSQNEALIEFLDKPHNFNKWFKATFLEQLSGATRMNNRAIDIRPHYIERGHYLDNCMMRGADDKVASYYRVCNIEDALSLSQAEKFKLIHGYDMPPHDHANGAS